jgi:hypothetical protein
MTQQVQKNLSVERIVNLCQCRRLIMLSAICVLLVHEEIRKVLEQVLETVLISFRPGN